jgi:hypothetical protein
MTSLDDTLTALIDYATALRDDSDSTLDDRQLILDAILFPDDIAYTRDDPDYADLPAPLTDADLDAHPYTIPDDMLTHLRIAATALFNCRA